MANVVRNRRGRKQTKRKHKRRSIRVLKVLEIGAGGLRVGEQAGEFTRRIGSDARLRRVVLRYANRRPIKGTHNGFRAIAAVASDCEPNPANDINLDANCLSVRSSSVHVIVAIGPRNYGFRNESTARRFLGEASRVLKLRGELIVIGRFVNPWFNPGLGSRRAREYMRKTSREVGLRVANFLTPLGEHPLAVILRIRGNRFIQRSTEGKKLGPPSYFHRFVKRDE